MGWSVTTQPEGPDRSAFAAQGQKPVWIPVCTWKYFPRGPRCWVSETKPCSGWRWVRSGVAAGAAGNASMGVDQRPWPGPGRLEATVGPGCLGCRSGCVGPLCPRGTSAQAWGLLTGVPGSPAAVLESSTPVCLGARRAQGSRRRPPACVPPGRRGLRWNFLEGTGESSGSDGRADRAAQGPRWAGLRRVSERPAIAALFPHRGAGREQCVWTLAGPPARPALRLDFAWSFASLLNVWLGGQMTTDDCGQEVHCHSGTWTSGMGGGACSAETWPWLRSLRPCAREGRRTPGPPQGVPASGGTWRSGFCWDLLSKQICREPPTGHPSR